MERRSKRGKQIPSGTNGRSHDLCSRPFAQYCAELIFYNLGIRLWGWAAYIYHRKRGQKRSPWDRSSLCRTSMRPRLWVQSLSLGETRTIYHLVRAFLNSHPSWDLIISAQTLTGYHEAKRLFPDACGHFIFPLDKKKRWNVWLPFSILS